MQYKLNKLGNGLRVLTVPMSSHESATLTVWVKTGSRNEAENVGGISHFLEHMVFKGSRKRKTTKAITEVLDSIGGEFNAATSKDYTLFYVKSSLETFDIATDVLSDMVLTPLLEAKEIEREKGTIVQEIAMYEDSPSRNIHDVFENLIFKGNSLEKDIAGTPDSVKSMKREDFVNYRDEHYHTDKMLVTVAGGIKEKDAVKLANKYFNKVAKNKIKQNEKPIEDLNLTTGPNFKLKNKKTEQANFILGFTGDGRKYKNRYAQSVLSAILGANMSSRLFTEVRERRGLAYFVRSSVERYQDIGYLGTYAGVDPKKAEEAIKIILDQCYGLASKKYPVGKKEFEKAKGFLKGRFALSLEDAEAVSDFFAEQELFDNERLTPKDVVARLEKVTIDDVYEEANRLFIPSHLNLALIGPYTNEDKFKKLLK